MTSRYLGLRFRGPAPPVPTSILPTAAPSRNSGVGRPFAAYPPPVGISGALRVPLEAVAPRRLGTPFRWLLASTVVTNLGDGVLLAAGPLIVAS